MVLLPQYFLLHLSYGIHHIQYHWLGISENKKAAFSYMLAYSRLLVYTRDLEGLGLLFVYRLALAGKRSIGLPGPIRFLYPFPAAEING